MSDMSPPRTRATPVRFADSWASVHFDSLRGLAAIFVMLGHWRNIFFIDYPQLAGDRRWWALPYLMTSGGHQAVILFFVLSGYFIGGTVLRSLERDQWQWSGYLLRRFVRLWIVLVPALLLCLFWDKLGIQLGHAPALYSGHSLDHIVPDVTERLSPGIFFGNLFFLQTILTPVLGTNGPLWSLANEFWYYLLFPLGIMALWPRTRLENRVLCTVLFFAIAWFVRGGLLLGFPIWLAGVVLFKLPAPSFPAGVARYARLAATLIYLPIFFAMGRIHLPAFIDDYILGLFTLAYLWVLLSARDPYPATDISARGSRELARFSYTLYATHLPLLVFAASLLVGNSRWSPTPAKVLSGIGVLVVTLAYAYGLAYSTEFRTDSVRMGIERIFGRRSGRRPEPSMLPSDPMKDPPGHAQAMASPPEPR